MKTRVTEFFDPKLGIDLYTVWQWVVIPGRYVAHYRVAKETNAVEKLPDTNTWHEIYSTPSKTKAEAIARRIAVRVPEITNIENWWECHTIAEFDGENRLK